MSLKQAELGIRTVLARSILFGIVDPEIDTDLGFELDFIEAESKFFKAFNETWGGIKIAAGLGWSVTKEEEKFWQSVEKLAGDIRRQLPSAPCFNSARKRWRLLANTAQRMLAVVVEQKRIGALQRAEKVLKSKNTLETDIKRRAGAAML